MRIETNSNPKCNPSV